MKINIETKNAAFEDDGKEYEVARILREVADRVEEGETGGTCRDINGNRVGSWKL